MRAAARRPGEDDRKPIDEAPDSAGQLLAEGRDRVAGLRGESVMQAASTCARGKPSTLDGAVCDAVFAIAREAIWNAFVHARPHKVTVTLAYDRRELVSNQGQGTTWTLRVPVGPAVIAAAAKAGGAA